MYCCITFRSTFLYVLFILIYTVYMRASIAVSWISRLAFLLFKKRKKTAIKIYLFWSLHKIPAGSTLITCDWFILLHPNQLSEQSEMQCSIGQACITYSSWKHLLHINKIGLDWRRDCFLRENKVWKEEKLILGKKTLTIYHTWVDCFVECLLVWGSHELKLLQPGKWKYILPCVRCHLLLSINTFLFS